MGVLSRKERELMEHHLRRHEIYNTCVENYYAGLGSVRRPEVMASSNLPGNPTERQALAGVEPPEGVQLAQRWLQVHRMTAERLNGERRDFMRAVFYRDDKMADVMDEFAIERSTYFRWCEEVVFTFALCAIAKRMLIVNGKVRDYFG